MTHGKRTVGCGMDRPALSARMAKSRKTREMTPATKLQEAKAICALWFFYGAKMGSADGFEPAVNGTQECRVLGYFLPARDVRS